MSLGEDLYETLGVSRYADKGEIKRAYIQLAKKWHPDKNRDSSDAVEMMEKINKAYRVRSFVSCNPLVMVGGSVSFVDFV
jgi:DnaJ-class molecular chaperone